MAIPLRKWALLAFAAALPSQALPYNPTRILLPLNTSSAYIFQPSTQIDGQASLSVLDLSTGFTTVKHPTLVVSATLPFLQSTESLPYTPIIDGDGNITIVTGNCAKGAEGAQIWRFARDPGSSGGNGTWTRRKTSNQELGSQDAQAGASFLASGLAFSENVDANASDTSFFIFGGMCPYQNRTADTWTSSASYSNLMLTLSAESSDAGKADYDISLAASRGPPISEAGFSLSALPPTYSSDNQSQQQDFVLLGGHTQAAFINMSQLAMFSLPQESWTFLSVDQPSIAKTDLTARQGIADVEPRSGHTAVLAEDGKSIVVFGGWVGDVTNPAQPQLAVLRIGAGYGGDGGWSWTVPEQSGQGFGSGSGIYGHGAAMLPGGVMMVMGGYAIPITSSKRGKRDAQTANDLMYLYNVTSNSWIHSYTQPSPSAAQAQLDQSAGTLSSIGQRAGLGAGLAIGAILLIVLVAFYLWYTHRLKRSRQKRERTLLSGSSDGSVQISEPLIENGGIDGRGGDIAAGGSYWQDTERPVGDEVPWVPQVQQNGNATGLFVNIPSPTRGLRRGLAGRNYQYHAAPRYDEKRVSRGSGTIHPIAEHDDEDHAIDENVTLTEVQRQLKDLERVFSPDADRQLREVERVLGSMGSRPVSDPFLDHDANPLGSHPVSPEVDATVRRVPTGASRAPSAPRPRAQTYDNSANWATVEGASEPLLYENPGRISPSKTDERTSSTLSEMSQRSTTSSNSIARTMSTRTGALLAAAAAAAVAEDAYNRTKRGNHSPSDERSHIFSTIGGRKSPFLYQSRARSNTSGSAQGGAPNSASTDADSFTTARSTFKHLQSESEALLGGRAVMDRDDPYQRALAAHSSTTCATSTVLYQDDAPAPPLAPRRRQGFMGSLRKALGAVSDGTRSFSLTGNREQYADNERSTSSSPIKGRRITATPRRAISDGGALLRQKRGKSDWDDKQWPPYHDDPNAGDWGQPGRTSLEKQQAEEEWDVEDAVTKRDVQVMFTVPKARLRVVNADIDRASLRSASEGALSRTESLKALRREESMGVLRMRSEGEKLPLAPAEEKNGVERPPSIEVFEPEMGEKVKAA